MLSESLSACGHGFLIESVGNESVKQSAKGSVCGSMSVYGGFWSESASESVLSGSGSGDHESGCGGHAICGGCGTSSCHGEESGNLRGRGCGTGVGLWIWNGSGCESGCLGCLHKP